MLLPHTRRDQSEAKRAQLATDVAAMLTDEDWEPQVQTPAKPTLRDEPDDFDYLTLPKPNPSTTETVPEEDSGERSLLGRMCLIVCLLFGSLLGYYGLTSGDSDSVPPSSTRIENVAATQPSHPRKRLKTIAIEDARLGMRSLGTNPLREQVDPSGEPNQETWRELHLWMRKVSGKRLDIELLRHLDWIAEHGARVGNMVYINLPEMGAQGWANITYLGACPCRVQHRPYATWQ